jgi:hypothetical protein
MTAFHKVDKTAHPIAGTLICKNNFFNNPKKVIELANRQTYKGSERFPGKRTINLLESTDAETKEFAVFFAKKIARDVFPGIKRFVIHISFHINDVYDDDHANAGWIHNDDVTLAGLVYLNENEVSFNTGTSIFLKQGERDFSIEDYASRKKFNVSGIATDQYKQDLDNNHADFLETIRVGNLFNRLIAYDSNLWHRPNNFKIESNQPRTTLLFFIDFYEFESFDVGPQSSWID